jgi:uncharacterized protein YjiS (DUF1127 family)
MRASVAGKPLENTMYNSLIVRVGRSIARWQRAQNGRRELALLDDRALADLGIARSQIYSAVISGRER